MVRVLVDNLSPRVVERMRRELATDEIQFSVSESHDSFGDAVRRCAPHVAVLGCVHRCLPAAHRKVDLLKDLCPRVRIIAISDAPSADDGVIVEQGLFFYMTSTGGSELIRIIRAAVRASMRESPALPDRSTNGQ